MKITMGAIVAVVLIYQIAFSRPVVRTVIQRLVPATVELSFELRRASLLFGFEFDNVLLKDRLSGDPIFRADQVRVKWFLPGYLGGQIGIRELGLLNPTVSLVKRNGRWNTDALSPGDEEKKKETASSSRDAIELMLPVRLFGALHVEGLRFLMVDNRPDRTTRLDVADVDLHFSFITKTFHRIPLDLSAVDLVDSLFVAFNPVRPFRFEYTEMDRVAGRPLLVLKMYRETDGEQTTFVTRLRAESRDLSLITPGGLQFPFDMALHYDIFYDPLKEHVVVRNLKMLCGPDVWLSLSGSLSRDSEGYHHIDVTMSESKILLDRIAPLLVRLTDGRIQAGGALSLFPLTLKGRLDRLQVEVGVTATGLNVRTGTSFHSVPRAKIDLRSTVDLYALGFLRLPESYAPDHSIAYGIVREAIIESLDLGYNGASLRGSGTLEPGRGIDLSLNLSGLDLCPFAEPAFTAIGGAALHAQSGTDFRRISLQGTVTLDGARYRVDRSLSAPQNLRLEADLDVHFPGKGMSLELRRAFLNDYDLKGQRLATILLAGQFAFGDAGSYNVNLQKLDVDYENLQPTLPGNLRANLASVHSYLEKGLLLDGRASLLFEKGKRTIQGNLNLVIPSISRDGLNLRADVVTDADSVQLREVQLSGLRGALHAETTGVLAGLTGTLRPNIDFRLNLSRQGMLPVHENVSIDGSLELIASIRPEKIDGTIDIRRFNAVYSNTGCTRGGSPCTRYHIEDLNFSLPFHHDMRASPVHYESMLNPDLMERFSDLPNLTLRALWSNRSPDGLEVAPGFYFLGAPSPLAPPALESNLRYYKNILEGRKFRISTFRLLKEGEAPSGPWVTSPAGDGFRFVSNGTIEIRNLYFNAADLKPASMEYGAHLSVHDLNIEPYFPRADSAYDGIVSASAQVRGGNLADPIRNVSARLAVYRISKDFTGLAVRIMVPSAILARLVNNTLEIPSLSAELHGGLVYTEIQVSSPGFLAFSRLIRPRDETIRQERIPLAEFLERTKKETAEF